VDFISLAKNFRGIKLLKSALKISTDFSRFATKKSNRQIMKKGLFKILVKINKALLPSLYKKDPNKLTTFQKAILGYRYWVLTNALD